MRHDINRCTDIDDRPVARLRLLHVAPLAEIRRRPRRVVLLVLVPPVVPDRLVQLDIGPGAGQGPVNVVECSYGGVRVFGFAPPGDGAGRFFRSWVAARIDPARSRRTRLLALVAPSETPVLEERPETGDRSRDDA